MGTLKIGVALWSFGPTTTEDELSQSLDKAVEIGLEGVQLWCVDEGPGQPCVLDPDRCTGKKRAEIKKMIEDKGLAISAFCAQLGSPRGLGGFNDDDSAGWCIAKTKECLTLAAEMDAPIVTTHPGAIPENKEDPLYGAMLERLGEVARHGEEVGAAFAIETGQEPGEVLKNFIEDLSSEALRVNYDPANMLRHGTLDGVKHLAPYIVHTHAKDRHPQTRKPTVGRGEVPWDPYITLLKGFGYEGWYAIEDESGKGVYESVRTGFEFLSQY